MPDSPEPRDDGQIPDAEDLYRGILPQWVKPGPEISSAAFKRPAPPEITSAAFKQTGHPSVDRATLSTPEDTLARRPRDVGVAALTAGEARRCNPEGGVAAEPLPENPAHAVIVRPTGLSLSGWANIARGLARSCRWAIAPRD